MRARGHGSAATASRTTVRLTPMPLIISCSEGKFCAGGFNLPENESVFGQNDRQPPRGGLWGVPKRAERLAALTLRRVDQGGGLYESCLVIVQVNLIMLPADSKGTY